jgi:hypothetical protein
MKNIRFRSLCLLLICMYTATVTGCDIPEAEPEEYGSEALYFERIARGHFSTFSDTTEAVVRTADEWADVSARLRFVEEPRGTVDFNQVSLLVVVLPVEESGYSIRFSGIEREDGRVLAYYEVEEPGEGCMPAYTEMSPFTVVAVRRFEEPVEFVRERSRYRCEHRRL